MNAAPTPTWTDEDLERSLDGELPPAEAESLRADLLADPTLRSRLDRVRALDAAILRALTESPAPRQAGRAAFPIRRCITALAAIALCVALPISFFATSTRSEAPAPIAQSDPPIPHAPRIVFAVALDRPAASPAIETAAPAVGDAALVKARGRGDGVAALDLLAAGPAAERAGAWRRVGELMVSAETAREALLMLPLDDQLTVLGVWAERPALRFVAFNRLRELIDDPVTRRGALDLRDHLAQDPAMWSWVHSYAAAR
ncbi:MAG: hypothetical protein VYC34_11570 [Planctomycetota bacterium]|nr:hypothetical protein [Planctomycetota bacterium]